MLQNNDYTCNNLKICNGEFCTMWKCARYEMEYPCTCCSIIEDINEMAKALHLNVQSWEGTIAQAA